MGSIRPIATESTGQMTDTEREVNNKTIIATDNKLVKLSQHASSTLPSSSNDGDQIAIAAESALVSGYTNKRRALIKLKKTRQNVITYNTTRINNFSTLRETTKSAFFNLNPKPSIISPFLPDERRKVWLENQRRHHNWGQFTQRNIGADNGGFDGEFPMNDEGRVIKFNSTITQTCTASVFKHKIKLIGCEPKYVINRFCHGSCSSFYIPQLRINSKKAEATFQSYSACVPNEREIVKIKLNCPGREENEVYRTVVIIKNCFCKDIELGESDEPNDNN